MVMSMTAFARIQDIGELGEYVWELRSINHRFLEIHIRLPEELRALEPLARERLQSSLKRGKVECNLRFKAASIQDCSLRFNAQRVAQLLELQKKIQDITQHPNHLTTRDILMWPGVIEEQSQDLAPVQQQALRLLDLAIDQLIGSRRQEGLQLAELLRQRGAEMRHHADSVRQRMPLVLQECRQRIEFRLQEVRESLDKDRVEQEMILLAHRLDVAEELDRLNIHLDDFENFLGKAGPHGRRLDFLMQELNRETNTLTSKISDIETTRHAVDMKVLLEQMREQIQNIE